MLNIRGAARVSFVVRQQIERMKPVQLYIPTTKRDLFRRSAVRIGCCALAYLLLARSWSHYRDDRFFNGFWFLWCVVVIPGIGLALDVWRLTQTRDGGSKAVEPGTAPNGGPAAPVRNSGVAEGPSSVS